MSDEQMKLQEPDFTSGVAKLAVAVVHRDLEGLRAEVEFERMIAAKRVEAP
jgi:hypothetical protein